MPTAELKNFKMNYEMVEGVVPDDTLFVHGNTGSNRWWLPVLQSLRSRATPGLKGKAIFAEWRGCGQSSVPIDASELDPKILGGDYVDLLEKLGVTSASVVGHSLGGLIALHAVAAKPDLFRRILLANSVGPKGIPYDESAYDYFANIPTSRDSCARALSFSFFENKIDTTLFDRLVDDAMKMAPINWASIWRMLSRFDARGVIATITQPTLVVHGENDLVLPLEEARSLAETLPQSRLMVLKNCGHSPNVENAAGFTAMLSAFLYENETRSELLAHHYTKDQTDEPRDDRRHRPVRSREGRPELVL